MQLQTIQVLQENEKRIEYLLLEEKALQNEIRFGDGNTTDTKISLYQKDTEAYLRNIDIKMMRSKYANQIDIKEFEKLLRDKTETLKNSAERDTQNSINIANADFDRQIQLEKDRIEAKEDLSVKYFRDETGRINAEVKIRDEQIKEIRIFWQNGGITKTKIGLMYNVCNSHICDIINKKKRIDIL